MTIPQIAALLDLPERQVRRLMRKHSYLVGSPRIRTGTYPRSVVELLRTVLDRNPNPDDSDWLNRYLQPKEQRNG